MKINIVSILLIGLSFSVSAQKNEKKDSLVIYKQIDTVSLEMKIIYPPITNDKKKHPCIVFFFGGGWIGGNNDQFMTQATHFAKEGLVCFLADYRVRSRQGTTPFESLKDAKSAIRFIRENADRFNIITDSLIAAGGSAGGQLAAAAALTEGYNESGDDLSISAKPDALILFNPVIDNGPGGYGFERLGDEYKNFSPLHNIHKGAPPTLIFLGTNDQLVPVETAQYYKKVMEKVGSSCDLILYPGAGHGFFNKEEYKGKTILEADQFLTLLGYLRK